MSSRQPRGRQRIPIQRIESQDDLYATFSKRRLGLFKKASELSTLCGVDIGIIMFSPTGNPFSFFSPTMESVIDRCIHPHGRQSDLEVAIDSHSRERIKELNMQLDELSTQRQAEEARARVLQEQNKITRQKGWWEEIPIKQMKKEQLEELTTWLQDFLDRFGVREEEINRKEVIEKAYNNTISDRDEGFGIESSFSSHPINWSVDGSEAAGSSHHRDGSTDSSE